MKIKVKRFLFHLNIRLNIAWLLIYCLLVFHVININAAEGFIWAKQTYPSPVGNCVSKSMSTKNDIIFVSGTFSGDIDFNNDNNLTSYDDGDLFVVKYIDNGYSEWAIKISRNAFINDNGAIPYIEALQDGGIIVCGGFTGTLYLPGKTIPFEDNYRRIFVAKFNSNGILVWEKIYASDSQPEPGDPKVQFSDIVEDVNSDIFLVGYISRCKVTFKEIEINSKKTDGFLLKLSSTGEILKLKHITGTEYEFPEAICIDESNNIYLTGYYKSNIEFDDENHDYDLSTLYSNSIGFLAKYNTNCNIQWSQQQEDQVMAYYEIVYYEANQSLFISGRYSSQPIWSKYSLDGTNVWTKDNGPGGLYPVPLVVDLQNNIRSIEGNEINHIKTYNNEGIFIGDEIEIGQNGNISNLLIDISTLPVVTGTFNDILILGNTTLESGNDQMFIAGIGNYNISGKLVGVLSVHNTPVTVSLYKSSDLQNPIQTSGQTNLYYEFEDVEPGEYRIKPNSDVNEYILDLDGKDYIDIILENDYTVPDFTALFKVECLVKKGDGTINPIIDNDEYYPYLSELIVDIQADQGSRIKDLYYKGINYPENEELHYKPEAVGLESYQLTVTNIHNYGSIEVEFENVYEISGNISGVPEGTSVILSGDMINSITAYTDADGNYSFGLQFTGDYTVTPNLIYEYNEGSYQDIELTDIDVTVNFTRMETFTITGILEGKEASEDPVVQVELYNIDIPSDPVLKQIYTPPPVNICYAFINVPAGEYKIVPQTDPGKRIFEPYYIYVTVIDEDIIVGEPFVAEYWIEVNVVDGKGNITPGSDYYNSNVGEAFTIQAETGYKIKELFIRGILPNSTQEPPVYFEEAVGENVYNLSYYGSISNYGSIEAEFERIPYNVIFKTSEYGTMEYKLAGFSEQTVPENSTKTVNMIENYLFEHIYIETSAGFAIEKLTIDGVEITEAENKENYTITESDLEIINDYNEDGHNIEAVYKFLGDIKGVISDAATGDPIEGVLVTLHGLGIITKTNSNGEYFFHSIVPGVYEISLTHKCYDDYNVPDLSVPGDNNNWAFDFSMDHIAYPLVNIEFYVEDHPFQYDRIDDLTPEESELENLFIIKDGCPVGTENITLIGVVNNYDPCFEDLEFTYKWYRLEENVFVEKGNQKNIEDQELELGVVYQYKFEVTDNKGGVTSYIGNIKTFPCIPSLQDDRNQIVIEAEDDEGKKVPVDGESFMKTISSHKSGIEDIDFKLVIIPRCFCMFTGEFSYDWKIEKYEGGVPIIVNELSGSGFPTTVPDVFLAWVTQGFGKYTATLNLKIDVISQ